MTNDISIISENNNTNSNDSSNVQPDLPDSQLVENEENVKRLNRQVTFKEDVEVQIYPVDYSSNEYSDLEYNNNEIPIDEDDDDDDDDMYLYYRPSSSSSPPLIPQSLDSDISVTNPPIERISKKATYEALQYRKQARRREYQLDPSSNWYNDTFTQSSLPPTLRSVESTDRLMTESIQRELFLYPPISHDESILIQDDPIGPKQEDQEEDDRNDKLHQEDRIEPVVKLDIFRHSTPSLKSDSEDDESIVNQNDNLLVDREDIDHPSFIPYLSRENDSIQNLPSIQEDSIHNFQSTQNDSFISFVDRDHSCFSPNQPHYSRFYPLSDNSKLRKRKVFFLQILKAEKLNLPIDTHASIYCNVRYQEREASSPHQPLAHSLNFNHQVRIMDIDPDEQIKITIHKKPNSVFKRNWYKRLKPSFSELDRYLHEKDGTLCQATFLPGQLMKEEGEHIIGITLTNHWYRTSQPHSSLLYPFKKAAPIKTGKQKEIGKLYIKCFYIDTLCDSDIPRDMSIVIDALNAKRFHQTVWQEGYLYQLGGYGVEAAKRYFKLIGGILFSYTSEHGVSLYQLPLSCVNKLGCDDSIISERSIDTQETPISLIHRLQSIIAKPSTNHNPNIIHKFNLELGNGYILHLGCDTYEEKNRWVSILKLMMRKLPSLPDWINV